MWSFCFIYCILSCIVSSEKFFWPLCELVLVNPFISTVFKEFEKPVVRLFKLSKVYILVVLRNEVCLLEDSVLDLLITGKMLHHLESISFSNGYIKGYSCVEICFRWKNVWLYLCKGLKNKFKKWGSNFSLSESTIFLFFQRKEVKCVLWSP